MAHFNSGQQEAKNFADSIHPTNPFITHLNRSTLSDQALLMVLLSIFLHISTQLLEIKDSLASIQG